MTKKIISLLMIFILVNSGFSVLADTGTNTDTADIIVIDAQTVSDDILNDLGLEGMDIANMTIQNTTQSSKSSMARTAATVETDVGVLIAETYDEELEANQLVYTLVFNEDGDVMTTSELTSYLATTPTRTATYAQMIGQYKIYTDGFSEVYVNPYKLTLKASRSGMDYLSGDMIFHGTQVYTSDFSDISGTDCSTASKYVFAASPLAGNSYSSTGYYYSSSKALRVYSCGFHSDESMYMEYSVSGTVYSFNFNVGDF